MKNILAYLGLTAHQETVQQKAIRLIIKQGCITQWEVQQLGTTSASKLITRIRRKGYIGKFVRSPNADGRGFHHVYIWSGRAA